MREASNRHLRQGPYPGKRAQARSAGSQFTCDPGKSRECKNRRIALVSFLLMEKPPQTRIQRSHGWRKAFSASVGYMLVPTLRAEGVIFGLAHLQAWEYVHERRFRHIDR